MNKFYNPKDKESIYEYAKKLKGKTFYDVCKEYESIYSVDGTELAQDDEDWHYINRSHKGGLGEIIEERYFHYKPDNESRADFPESGVELKVTPYKVNKNNTISSKERLIISMINYMNIVNMEFFNSNAWEKIKNILLIYYLWDPNIKNRLEYCINFVYLYSPNKEDLEIIKNDYNIIKNKVVQGKAHELSEGDTIYLGAATKSSDSRRRTHQPFSSIMAKPRAFSLKNSYMTYVLRNYIQGNEAKDDKIIKNETVTDFEDYIINKINKYKGMKDKDLFRMFFSNENLKDKDKYSRVAYEILGVKTKNAEEFEKANIIVKAVRIEKNKKIRESMSFPYFKIKELVNEEWDDSEINRFFNETKFLFVIYVNNNGDYYLKGAKFWNMPIIDIEGKLKEEWERARDTFREGVKFTITKPNLPIQNNLPKKSNTEILHVRPHASKSAYLINGVKYGNGELGRDTDELPDGNLMTKQCFWLNNDYVAKIVTDKDI